MRKQLQKNSIIFFENIEPKVVSKILVSNTYFEQYVTYEGANLERKELCDEELKNDFSSLKIVQAQSTFTYSKLTIETQGQGVKYVQS